MRELILLGAAAIALSGCGGEQSAEERAAAERNVTSEVVQTNDTTAIDAATGEAAEMAADVPEIPSLENELVGNEVAPAAATRGRTSDSTRNRAPSSRAPQADAPDDAEANSL